MVQLRLTLPENEVHVWRARLDLPLPRMLHLVRTLGPAEVDRASRFRSPCDRSRFVAHRGILRQICGAYLAIEPERIAFGHGPCGKPYLSKRLDRDALRFNMSHSHTVALYALTLDREVGIDIERVRYRMAWQSIAAECLSDREVAALRTVPPAAQTRVFFTIWTRKEAYVKARGMGLSTRLTQIDVLGRGIYSRVLTETSGRWQEPWFGSVQDLDVGPHDAAALAVEEQGLAMVFREWR